MIVPRFLPLWHVFAYGGNYPVEMLAMREMWRHCFPTEHDHGLAPRDQFCFPSPSPRSGRVLAGPFHSRSRVWNRPAGQFRKSFASHVIAVDSAAITTNPRGNHLCANRLSSSLFSRPLWRAACRILPRAVRRVPLRGSSSRMRPMATCLPVPSSAALPGLPPAASISACRPATDLTACGRLQPTTRTIRASRPGGPLLFAA